MFFLALPIAMAGIFASLFPPFATHVWVLFEELFSKFSSGSILQRVTERFCSLSVSYQLGL